MIEIRNLNKAFWIKGKKQVVAENINVTFPTGVSVALLGRNGAGKSSLLRMISGFIEPDMGSIYSDGTVSWPVGFSGSFHKELSGSQNIKFVARIYGVDTAELEAFVKDFAKLGQQYYLPVRSYSSGMRSRLAFAASMGIHFDTYLVDEVTSVGDADFKSRSRALFSDRMRESGAIFVSHSLRKVRKMCQAGAVLEEGRLTYYDDVVDAINHHEAVLGTSSDDDD